MLRKKRNSPKLAALKQRAVLIAFFFRFSGPINGDPSSLYLIASRWDYESLDATIWVAPLTLEVSGTTCRVVSTRPKG
jgi:hypothetical protein